MSNDDDDIEYLFHYEVQMINCFTKYYNQKNGESGSMISGVVDTEDKVGDPNNMMNIYFLELNKHKKNMNENKGIIYREISDSIKNLKEANELYCLRVYEVKPEESNAKTCFELIDESEEYIKEKNVVYSSSGFDINNLEQNNFGSY